MGAIIIINAWNYAALQGGREWVCTDAKEENAAVASKWNTANRADAPFQPF